jgi:hypothetical protein
MNIFNRYFKSHYFISFIKSILNYITEMIYSVLHIIYINLTYNLIMTCKILCEMKTKYNFNYFKAF